jgi:hypothetical protein
MNAVAVLDWIASAVNVALWMASVVAMISPIAALVLATLRPRLVHLLQCRS